jgi:predicted enzyme related to lactoylglutathione lyase
VTCRLINVNFDAINPPNLARFWAELLEWETGDTSEGYVELLPTDDSGFEMNFLPTQAPKIGPNQMHFHLTSTSIEDQGHIVEKALALGARHIDVGQRPEEGHVVLADPEGNEFCVIEPGNKFLADCGFFGEITCEGSRDVGHFWSAALGWPLVWDQNQETSIRSPNGGPKISWGGPPLTPKRGKYRLHFDVSPPADGDQLVEVDRLISLGATRVDIDQGDVDWVVMVDPDGHEFCVLTPR